MDYSVIIRENETLKLTTLASTSLPTTSSTTTTSATSTRPLSAFPGLALCQPKLAVSRGAHEEGAELFDRGGVRAVLSATI